MFAIYAIFLIYTYIYINRERAKLAVKEKNAEDTISNYEASTQFSAGV